VLGRLVEELEVLLVVRLLVRHEHRLLQRFVRYRSGQPGQQGLQVTWRRAAWRWLAIGVLLGALSLLYLLHPIYRGPAFAPWRTIFIGACAAWAVLGLPYAYATVRRFGTPLNDLREPAVHWMVLARALLRGRFGRAARNPRVATSLRSLGVKVFFLPLITSFLAGHAGSLSRAWSIRHGVAPFSGANVGDWLAWIHANAWTLIPKGADLAVLFDRSWYALPNLRFAADAYYDLLFIVDCGVALIGYGLESRWLRNKTRSVESTALGWIVALACYPPFNDVLGTILPLGDHHVWMSPNTQLACRFGSLAAFTIYAWATLSFGLRFSNLTNRGIIERGPYRFVRHPAYVSKSLAWWLESLPSLTASSAIFLLLLNGVYALRAWTEERHLSLDPDYRAYKRRVRWRLLPGVV